MEVSMWKVTNKRTGSVVWEGLGYPQYFNQDLFWIEWIDLDYHELNINGNGVKPFCSLDDAEYDHLIIATINPSNFDWIKEELALMGVNETKFVEINTDMNQIGRLLGQLGFDEDFIFQQN